MSSISLQNIKKSYGETLVIPNLDLEIKDKEFVVLVGPSGCGKSTTLRMIAGLEDITGGDLKIDNKKVNEVSPSDRGVAMVFQDYALYPHMTVAENLSFSMRLKGAKKDVVDKRVDEVAKMLDLTPYLERRPVALSGGQRQRVAMGRAIMKNSKVFLYDEPLSNLDAKLRSKMRGEIKRFHLSMNTTSVYVTHDQLEAMTLADKLVVMKDGHIEQQGTPMEVFGNPRTVFVASFIGSPSMNFFTCTVKKSADGFSLIGDNQAFEFALPKSKEKNLKDSDKVILGVRPSDIFISTETDQIPSSWKCESVVEMVELLGKNAFVSTKIGDYECLGEIGVCDLPKIGDKVKLSFNLNYCHLFDPKTQINLG